MYHFDHKVKSYLRQMKSLKIALFIFIVGLFDDKYCAIVTKNEMKS